jgi:DNA polymerase III epsilon subunit
MLDKPIDDVEFTVLDVETTGLETYFGHRMCEIGLVKFRGPEELGSYSSLINPERSIPEDAIGVHGITDGMVRNAPVFESIANNVLTFIEGTVLIAHNAEFDLGFLAKRLRMAEQEVPDNLVVDTLLLARKHFSFQSNALGAIASRLVINTEGNHRALKDATITKEVFRYFVRRLEVKTLGELLDLQGGSIPFPEEEETISMPAIDEALRSGRKLSITYLSASGEETERIVAPIEVNVRRGAPYLVAYCHLRKKQRTFRMDRISELHLVEPHG